LPSGWLPLPIDDQLGVAEEHQLICAECATEADPEARGWRAHLNCDDNIVTFCPECAEREFGPCTAPDSARPAGESSTPAPGLEEIVSRTVSRTALIHGA
jgi:hypothetical protein